MADQSGDEAPAPFDLSRIVATLNRHGVDYLVIGGIAVLAHGNPRATFDVDVVADLRRTNLERLAGALAELNARLTGVDAHLLPVDPTNPDDLANGANWTMTTDAGRLDFFSEVPGGRPYAELRGRAVLIETAAGSFHVVGLHDLARMKREAGRPKDLADLAALNLANPGSSGEELHEMS